jgi:hypothetical protein
MSCAALGKKARVWAAFEKMHWKKTGSKKRDDVASSRGVAGILPVGNHFLFALFLRQSGRLQGLSLVNRRNERVSKNTRSEIYLTNIGYTIL